MAEVDRKKNPTGKPNPQPRTDLRPRDRKTAQKQWPSGTPPERLAKNTKPVNSNPPSKQPKSVKPKTLTMKPPVTEAEPEKYYCSSCSGIVDDEKQTLQSIQCDTCKEWVHARGMCSGLNAQAYEVLSDNANLTYKCSKCFAGKNSPGKASSTGPNNSVSQRDFNQLSEMVRGICSQLAKMIDGNAETGMPQKPTARKMEPKGPDDKAIRKMIREETQDRLEREKRREYVMIRGFETEESDDDCADFVSEIFEMLVGREVTFSDFLRFDRRPDLVRVKVLNERDRKAIIANASDLRNSPKSRFFVRRDLTYLQRQVLTERYNQRKAAESAAQQREGDIREPHDVRTNDVEDTEPAASADERATQLSPVKEKN